MKDLITISIPVYNVEKYVEKALLSALNQTYENIEYIIADDKGTDNSMSIVRNIVEQHPRGVRVKIVEHEKNIGTGASRNTGIEHATGKYIFFMDSDDEITPDCIEILYAQMQKTPVDFVASSLIIKDREENTISQYIYEDKLFSGVTNIACKFYTSKKRDVTLWNKLYNLDFLKNNNIRCIPSHLNEDNIFTFQVILNASSCRYISNITYIYYDSPGSITKSALFNKISERYALQYVESINFKRNYIGEYKNEQLRETVFKYIIFQTKYYAGNIANSKILTKQQKKYWLKQLLKYPVSFNEIIKFKNRLFFIFMYLVFLFPFTLTSFRIMDFMQKKTKG